MKLGLIFVGLMVLAVGLALQPLLARGGKGKNAKTLAFLGILIVVASGGVYYLVGSPAMVNSPTFLEGFNTGGGRASLTGQEPVFPSLEEIIDKQKAVVAQNPEDVRGWTRLARTLTGLERYGEAIAAYRRAIALTPGNAGLFLALGEALTFRDQGLISDEALKAFETAVKLNPGELFSKLYLGDYSFQTGDVQLALVRWLALYEEAPVDTPWLPLLEQRILRAATALGQDDPQILAEKRFQEPANPSAEEIQQMTPEDQAAIIGNMVATLEARMEENPGDLAGWERLGRSYMVLERYQDGLYAFGLVA
ncbi:MAG: tetratricopeptide repeat protein, partial [Alphaproteobacteria bacterium]